MNWSYYLLRTYPNLASSPDWPRDSSPLIGSWGNLPWAIFPPNRLPLSGQSWVLFPPKISRLSPPNLNLPVVLIRQILTPPNFTGGPRNFVAGCFLCFNVCMYVIYVCMLVLFQFLLLRESWKCDGAVHTFRGLCSSSQNKALTECCLLPEENFI